MLHSKKKELLFLIVPAIFLSGLIYANLNNWGSLLTGDYIKFVRRARNFYWVDGLYPLGYPLLLKGFFLIVRDYLLAGKLISIVSSLIVMYLAGKIVNLIYSQRAGIISQFVLLVSPIFFLSSFNEGTDMANVALLFTSLYFLLKNNGRDRSYLLWSGVFMGGAYLIRYTTLIFTASTVIWLWYYGMGFKVKLKSSGIFILGFLITSSPQLIASIIARGNPFFNIQTQNIYFYMYGKQDWISNWGKYSGSFFDILINDPGGFIRHYINEWRIGLRIFGPIFIPAVIGVILSFFKKSLAIQSRQKLVFLFLLTIGCLASTAIGRVKEIRQLLPLIPLLCIPIGVLAEMGFSLARKLLIEKCHIKPIQTRLIWIPVSAVFIFLSAKQISEFQAPIIHLNKQICDVMLANGLTEPSQALSSIMWSYFHYSNIMERYDSFWWRQGERKINNDITFAEFENLVYKNNYRFVVFDDEKGLRHLAHLEKLFHNEQLSPRWELLFSNPRRPKIVVYGIRSD